MGTVPHHRKSNKNNLKSSLYLWNGYAMFLGNQTQSSVHQHHAVQIVIGLDQPVELHLQHQIHSSRVAIISADYPHRISSNAGWHVIIMLDPEREATKKLVAGHLKSRPFRLLDISAVAPLVPTLRGYIGRTHSGNSARKLCDGITNLLAGVEYETDAVDFRIQNALNLLNRLSVKKIALNEIARAIGLSEGRLVHLFKEQVGIPIRRYLLWLRLWVAVERVVHCGSLTCAAYAAEFADSAHLSRTFRKMFGMAMSEIFKRRQKIQIIPGFCSEN